MSHNDPLNFELEKERHNQLPGPVFWRDEVIGEAYEFIHLVIPKKEKENPLNVDMSDQTQPVKHEVNFPPPRVAEQAEQEQLSAEDALALALGAHNGN